MKTVTRDCRGRLDEPGALAEAVEPEHLGHLKRTHCVRRVLLVGQHKQRGIPELILVQKALQLFAGNVDIITGSAVSNEDNS